MTAITKDQICQSLFNWTGSDRNFHKGRFMSDRLCMFDEGGEKATIQFSVEQYTLEEIDEEGFNLSAWEVFAFCREVEYCVDIDEEEYSVCVVFNLGGRHATKQEAMNFCQTVLVSYLEHQNFSEVPRVKLVGTENPK